MTKEPPETESVGWDIKEIGGMAGQGARLVTSQWHHPTQKGPRRAGWGQPLLPPTWIDLGRAKENTLAFKPFSTQIPGTEIPGTTEVQGLCWWSPHRPMERRDEQPRHGGTTQTYSPLKPSSFLWANTILSGTRVAIVGSYYFLMSLWSKNKKLSALSWCPPLGITAVITRNVRLNLSLASEIGAGLHDSVFFSESSDCKHFLESHLYPSWTRLSFPKSQVLY